ncbi:hypothetical protein DGWBC_1733 [Dehalogenimonas sp. WBC-2]|nr:hypothetical protein DGWBC_1733 [Dehalogenimonas sp. WBC-2]
MLQEHVENTAAVINRTIPKYFLSKVLVISIAARPSQSAPVLFRPLPYSIS